MLTHIFNDKGTMLIRVLSLTTSIVNLMAMSKYSWLRPAHLNECPGSAHRQEVLRTHWCTDKYTVACTCDDLLCGLHDIDRGPLCGTESTASTFTVETIQMHIPTP